jgi:NADH:ubiquinone reductase (non-electrogenic)
MFDLLNQHRCTLLDYLEPDCTLCIFRKKLLSFVVVGGGPTGVEFAAELHDLVHEDLTDLYPHLEKAVSITVVQSGDHILNTFDGRISDYAEKKFSRDGVNVKIGSRVMEVNEDTIKFKLKYTGELVDIPYGMIVWSTGDAAN